MKFIELIIVWNISNLLFYTHWKGSEISFLFRSSHRLFNSLTGYPVIRPYKKRPDIRYNPYFKWIQRKPRTICRWWTWTQAQWRPGTDEGTVSSTSDAGGMLYMISQLHQNWNQPTKLSSTRSAFLHMCKYQSYGSRKYSTGSGSKPSKVICIGK